MSRPPSDRNSATREEHEAKALVMIRETIRSVRFGVVSVVIHDGIVMQVERTEKVRFATRREISGEGDGI